MRPRLAAPEPVNLAMPASFRKRAWVQRGLAVLAATGLVASAAAAPGNIGLVGSKRDDFQTAAPYAILVDVETGTVLFEKSADVATPPSSMAKLMTTEVVFNALKLGRIKIDDEYMVSEDAWRRGGAPSHTSSMFAPIHSRVRVEDLLRGAIVMSGNDACLTLAEGIAGNESAFVAMMNARAHELRLTKSYFTNSTGLPDPAQKVTVRELAGLARHIIRTYPGFYGIYGEHEFTWNKIRQQNRNPLLTMNLGADGMKTGFTVDGGYGLVGSTVQNGTRLIVAGNFQTINGSFGQRYIGAVYGDDCYDVLDAIGPVAGRTLLQTATLRLGAKDSRDVQPGNGRLGLHEVPGSVRAVVWADREVRARPSQQANRIKHDTGHSSVVPGLE